MSSLGGVRAKLLMISRRNWKATVPRQDRARATQLLTTPKTAMLEPPSVPLTNPFSCIRNDADSNGTSDLYLNCDTDESGKPHNPLGVWSRGPPAGSGSKSDCRKPLPLKVITPSRCWADDISDDEA